MLLYSSFANLIMHDPSNPLLSITIIQENFAVPVASLSKSNTSLVVNRNLDKGFVQVIEEVIRPKRHARGSKEVTG